RPAWTSSSALRRDAMPARASARWIRIAVDISDRLRLSAQRHRQLVGAREFLEMTQGELLQEQRRCAVHERSPQSFASPDDVDQGTLVQRLENRAAVHPADLFDLGAANRLSIGD